MTRHLSLDEYIDEFMNYEETVEFLMIHHNTDRASADWMARNNHCKAPQ